NCGATDRPVAAALSGTFGGHTAASGIAAIPFNACVIRCLRGDHLLYLSPVACSPQAKVNHAGFVAVAPISLVAQSRRARGRGLRCERPWPCTARRSLSRGAPNSREQFR